MQRETPRDILRDLSRGMPLSTDLIPDANHTGSARSRQSPDRAITTASAATHSTFRP
jgi:hypothetical protein